MKRSEHKDGKNISFLARHNVATYAELYKWPSERLQTAADFIKTELTNKRKL
jgi:hypothetical protein